MAHVLKPLVLLCFIVAGCNSAQSPAPLPTPTAARTQAAPTAAPTQAASTLEQQILSSLASTGYVCVEADGTGTGPLRHITCSSKAGDSPNLTVNTYTDRAALYAVFGEHVAFLLTGPRGATCVSGAFHGAYTVGGEATGEVLCLLADQALPSLEWTVDSLNLFVVAEPPLGWDAARTFAWWQLVHSTNGTEAVTVVGL